MICAMLFCNGHAGVISALSAKQIDGVVVVKLHLDASHLRSPSCLMPEPALSPESTA